jgi:hypothetical protein
MIIKHSDHQQYRKPNQEPVNLLDKDLRPPGIPNGVCGGPEIQDAHKGYKN